MKVIRVGSFGIDLSLPMDRPVASLLRRLPAIFVLVSLLTAQTDRKLAAIGAQMAADVRHETTPLHCPIASQFIDELGERLAPQLPGVRPVYQFSLVADDIGGREHEPFSLPGGYIFVPANLILTAKTEAEVARMLAHSMAHRFPATSGQISGYGSIPLVFIGGSLKSGSLGLLVPRMYQAQQEAIERDADLDASETLTASGYEAVRSAPPSAAFLAIQQEVRRVLRGSPLR